MSRIDVENAKQIRTPMDVLITMEVPDEGTTLTFSGYSSAKVADGELSEQWSMRLLADLQGNGFPLDGSRVLYDPNTTASATNGKIGVRSNIGQSVSVTVTGSSTIASLTIFVTGAESVTYNGTTSNIVGGQVIIPVGATSITLTFNPSNATDRIEVSQIVAGTSLRITNDSLIKCVVSLRSDLSIIEPTLPESELNVEVYNDADISEVVASLPEDTPITYQAGYPDDMSPLRKFYVSGQVTWADNVLSIHAVDAVHFLDFNLPASLVMPKSAEAIRGMAVWLSRQMGALIQCPSIGDTYVSTFLLDKGLTFRELIADFMWLWYANGRWCEYIDGGMPTFNFYSSKSAKWELSESDCGSVEKNVTPKIGVINIKGKTSAYQGGGNARNVIVGTLDWYKNGPAYISLNDYVTFWWANIPPVGTVLPNMKDGSVGSPSIPLFGEYGSYTDMLLDGETPESVYEKGIFVRRIYTQVIPWSAGSNGWSRLVSAGIIESTAESANFELKGRKYEVTPYEKTVGTGDESTADIELEKIMPVSETTTLFPDTGVARLFTMSNITGSFTWKGDPRMQPRDVVTWERLDGTEETITLENITLTHEQGGTSAEITYRKGIV